MHVLSACRPKASPRSCSSPVSALDFSFILMSEFRTPVCCPKLPLTSPVQVMENEVNPW